LVALLWFLFLPSVIHLFKLACKTLGAFVNFLSESLLLPFDLFIESTKSGFKLSPLAF
jgi:hypothetical protein